MPYCDWKHGVAFKGQEKSACRDPLLRNIHSLKKPMFLVMTMQLDCEHPGLVSGTANGRRRPLKSHMLAARHVFRLPRPRKISRSLLFNRLGKTVSPLKNMWHPQRLAAAPASRTGVPRKEGRLAVHPQFVVMCSSSCSSQPTDRRLLGVFS